MMFMILDIVEESLEALEVGMARATELQPATEERLLRFGQARVTSVRNTMRATSG